MLYLGWLWLDLIPSTMNDRYASIISLHNAIPTSYTDRRLNIHNLSLDSTYPPQSVRSWSREKDRNKVTPQRHTIYLAAPPEIEPGLEHIRKWTQPRLRSHTKENSANIPRTEDILSYLEALYHGLPVKMLPQHLRSFDIHNWKKKPQNFKSRILRYITKKTENKRYLSISETPALRHREIKLLLQHL